MAPVPEEILQNFTPSFQRTGLYPNLNYAGLFHGLVNLLNVFPQISTSQAGKFFFCLYRIIENKLLKNFFL